MPVTDLSGDDDWLQQYLAGYAAVPGGGPATWAPYGGHPTNYGPPNPLGAGAPQPQPQPQPQPSALGYSLTSNPVTNWFKTHPMPANQGVGGGYMGPYAGSPSPAAPATADPAAQGPPGYLGNTGVHIRPPDSQPDQGGGYPGPTTGPVSGANPANRGVGTTRTPGAGAPAGNPSQTPQTANSSRFVQVDRPNMDVAGGGMGRGGPPQMTALNLAGLFGGRGQQANPANVPAANAQPVSGALAPGGMSNAPWGMGPLQPGMNWPGAMGPFTQDQLAARGLRQRYG